MRKKILRSQVGPVEIASGKMRASDKDLTGNPDWYGLHLPVENQNLIVFDWSSNVNRAVIH